jgi:hypothetical protein
MIKELEEMWFLMPVVPVLATVGVVVLWMYFFGTLWLESKNKRAKISSARMVKWSVFFPLVLLSAVIMGAMKGIGGVLVQMRSDVLE